MTFQAERPTDSNLTGPLRARLPEQVRSIQAMLDEGVSALAVAEAFGVSVRTVYRYAEVIEYSDVLVGGWRATFASQAGRAPWRVGPWRAER